ncbi:MAG: MBL fold metallo-hydrolase [Fimbriimonadia bacterium]|nr:MBL fold metallo-hydrolase [Fimbriimonadia bacterium]
MEPDIITLPVGPLQANCFIVICPETRQAVVIDPGAEGDKIWQTLQQQNASLSLILATHGHFDHVLGVPELKKHSNAPFWTSQVEWELWAKAAHEHPPFLGLPVGEPVPEPDRFLEQDDHFEVGSLKFRVLSVPGHGPDHLVFLLETQPSALFSGDTLFSGSVGRTDIPHANAQTLLDAIQNRLLTLPDDTKVFPGHGRATTIGIERETNPYL